MKTWLALVVLAFASTRGFQFSENVPSMIGSENALPGEFPFIVSLQWILFGQSAHFCGGVILDPRWILTSAFCITSRPNAGFMEVSAGRHNLAISNEPGRIGHSVARTHIHPGFNIVFGRNDPHDLALILLFNPFPLNDRIRPIRLPQPDSLPFGPMTMVGWGGIGISASILRKATAFPIDLDVCRTAMNNLQVVGNIFNDTNFCTGPLSGQLAACNGDFGGPMIQGNAPNEVLVGLMSWGATPCGTNGAPSSVNTRVSAYISWITSITGIS